MTTKLFEIREEILHSFDGEIRPLVVFIDYLLDLGWGKRTDVYFFLSMGSFCVALESGRWKDKPLISVSQYTRNELTIKFRIYLEKRRGFVRTVAHQIVCKKSESIESFEKLFLLLEDAYESDSEKE